VVRLDRAEDAYFDLLMDIRVALEA